MGKINLKELGAFFSRRASNRCAWYVARELAAMWGIMPDKIGESNRGKVMAREHLNRNGGKPSPAAENWIAWGKENRDKIETMILTQKIFEQEQAGGF